LHPARHEQAPTISPSSTEREPTVPHEHIADTAQREATGEERSLVLAVDDNPDVFVLLKDALQNTPYTVLGVQDPAKVMEVVQEMHPSAITLDVMMPDLNGWQILHQLKGNPATASIPVVMLTVLSEPTTGYVLGADDYLVKPFSHLELFARIKAVLRRSELPSPVSAAPSFVSGEVTINFDSREVTVEGNPVKLTPTEYKLLYQLVRNAGRVLPFDMLLSKVWGDEYRGDMDYLKTYVSRLRKKLGDDPENPRYILTERSIGYRFVRISTP